MARVVIDIPDFIYEALKENPDCGTVNLNHIVAQGTVLPERHGDLISRSAIAREVLPYIDPETRMYVNEKLYTAPVVIKGNWEK